MRDKLGLDQREQSSEPKVTSTYRGLGDASAGSIANSVYMATLLLPTSHLRDQTGHFLATIPRAVFAESRPAVQLIFLMRSTVASGIVFHPSFHSFSGICGWALITI
jgi:hypothetical protein